MNHSHAALGGYLDPTAVTAQLMSGVMTATVFNTVLAFFIASVTAFSAYSLGSFAVR